MSILTLIQKIISFVAAFIVALSGGAMIPGVEVNPEDSTPSIEISDEKNENGGCDISDLINDEPIDITEHKAVFKNYSVPETGAATVKPENGYDYETVTCKTGETIEFPEAPVFNDYYTFIGWSTAEGDASAIVDSLVMPANDVTLYAIYERVQVMLIPKNDKCTTVIDRNGGTVKDYKDGSEWYVYGLEEYLTEDTLLNNYIAVQGDGRIEVVPLNVNFGAYRGTGSVINVYDRNDTADYTADDTLVESFRIIIFGDVNGDAVIRSVDTTIINNEVSGITSWHIDESDNYCAYMIKAADVSNDGFITAVDATLVTRNISGVSEINQITGRAS